MASDLDTVAREVCTHKQYAAWRLVAAGRSQRQTALILGISRAGVQSRLDGAYTRIAVQLDKGQRA